jgi:AsmA protein
MKWLKRLVIAVVVLVIVAVATPFIAVQLLDPTYIKSEIASRATAATGRTMTIDGDVELTAYPWLGAKLGRVTLGNADGFDAPFFARIEGASVRVKLLPLLDREVQMDTVTVNGLELNLSRTADGQTNWDDLAAPKAGAQPSSGADGQPLAALALGGVQVTSGRINWRDSVAGRSTTIADLALKTGALSVADLNASAPAVDVETSFTLTHNAPALRAAVKLKTRVRYIGEPEAIEAQALELALDSDSEGLNSRLKSLLSGEVRYELASQKLTIDGLKLGPTEAQSGPQSATLTADANALSVDLAKGLLSAKGLNANIERFVLTRGIGGSAVVKANVKASNGFALLELSQLSTEGAAVGGALGGKAVPFSLAGNVRLDSVKGTLAAPGFTFKSNGFEVNQTKGSLSVAGDLAMALKTQALTLPRLSVKGRLAGRAVRGGSANVVLNSALTADLKTGTMTLTGLKLALTELKTLGLTGDVRVSGNGTGNSKAQTLSVKNLTLTGKLKGSSLPTGAFDGTATLNAVANLAKQTVKISRFEAKAYDLSANGSVNLSGIGGAPQASGAIVLAPFSPRKIMTRFGQPVPVTADPKALRRASIKAKFSASHKRLRLSPLTLTVDQSTLRGTADIRNFNAPAYAFDVKVDRLDVARYLPPEKRGAAATPGAAAAAAATLPLDTLGALSAKGTLRIGKLRLANMNISNALAKVNAAKGLVRLSPVSARLYGGRYKGNIVLDARGKVAQMSFNEELASVNIGGLLKALKGKAPVTGIGTARVKLRTRGNNKDQLVAGLNGDAEFRVNKGTIRSIDIVRSICNLVEGGAGGETRFDDMTGKAKVVNGVVENDSLAVSSPLLRIRARGVVDLPRDALDYRGEVALVGTCKGQGGRVRNRLNGIDIPIRITGPIANPKPELDTRRIVSKLAEREIERKSQRITQKLQEKIGEKVGDQAGKALGEAAQGLLKGLLGN